MCVIYSECVGHTHDYEQERGIQSTGERKVLVCTRLKCIFPVFPKGSQRTRPCRGYKSRLEKDRDVPYLGELQNKRLCFGNLQALNEQTSSCAKSYFIYLDICLENERGHGCKGQLTNGN